MLRKKIMQHTKPAGTHYLDQHCRWKARNNQKNFKKISKSFQNLFKIFSKSFQKHFTDLLKVSILFGLHLVLRAVLRAISRKEHFVFVSEVRRGWCGSKSRFFDNRTSSRRSRHRRMIVTTGKKSREELSTKKERT